MSISPSHASGLWEERWHPLREEWVTIAAHRQNRPWSGAVVEAPSVSTPAYISDCYLCPGNERVGGIINPRYEGTYEIYAGVDTEGASTTAPLQGRFCRCAAMVTHSSRKG